MLTTSLLSITIFILLYYYYTSKNIKNKWLDQFLGSYIFWNNKIPNKLVRYLLLLTYIIFWVLFLYLEGINKQISIIYSCLLVFIFSFLLINKKEKFIIKLHKSVLQLSVWTGIIYVLVRCIDYWWISILSLLIPFLPFIYNKLFNKNKKVKLTGELITFDVIYIWLAIYTMSV